MSLSLKGPNSNTIPLTQEDEQQLKKALRRAEEFQREEEMELMRQPLEGQLVKFTNAIQGWQNRWFVLDTKGGELRYFLKEEHKSQQKPRGVMALAGAVVAPSEEDLSFTVAPVSGDTYKLKASDTRQRSEWINRLRVAAEDQKEKKIRGALKPRATPTVADNVRRGTAKEATMLYQLHQVATAATEQQQAMCRAIDALPSEEGLKRDILLLKATSQAVLSGIDHCQHMLLKLSAGNTGTPPGNRRKISRRSSERSQSLNPATKASSDSPTPPPTTETLNFTPLDELSYEEEVADWDDYKDGELGSVETNKTLILNILSRLKLGTDLTRVSFPTFILQSRSLLETCSDFFANAKLFVNIPDQPTPEHRMIELVKWYITSFYCGLRDGQVRKPYNPVTGEVFRCTWVVKDKLNKISARVHFFAEQVSHHPPVTAVYAQCPEKQLFFNCHISPRSKFMGMSMSAALTGEGCVVIGAQKGRRAEQYRFSFPTLYARSILTTPWPELGGKIHVTCSQRGISSAITFHTKPFYGGKLQLHRVSAELRNHSGNVFCKLQGEWNKSLELCHATDNELERVSIGGEGWAAERLIRPLEKQHPRESRAVWAELTGLLRSGAGAVEGDGTEREKRRVEEVQRNSGGAKFRSLHFQRRPDGGWLWSRGFPEIFEE